MPIQFPTGETFDIDFYVTLLDHLCPTVLGYNWLTHYNLLIDWVLGSITFQTPVPSGLDSDLTSTLALAPPMPLLTLTQDSPINPPTQLPNPSEPQIAFLDTVAFARACKEEGTESFQIHISNPNSGWSTQKSDTPVDLSSVPLEYHDYTDVFSKSKADTLPPHRPYDLNINLEEGTSPPLGLIYSLSSRTCHTPWIHQWAPQVQFYPSYKFSLWSPDPFCQEEKWTTLAMHQLLWSQLDHKERLLPTSAYHWSVGCSPESPHVYQDWSLTCLPPCPHCWRWWTKNCLLDPLQILWVVYNAFWTYQHTCCFPTFYE